MDKQLSFFELAYENFLSSKTEIISRFFRLAGHTFCLQFAGHAMVGLITPALKHLEIETCENPDLTICLWDSASTGTVSFNFPWKFTGFRGEVFELDSEEITTVHDIHTRVLHIFDKKRGLALYWIKDFRNLPWWITGSPLQLILHWWMRDKGYQLTHAAVVSNHRGGVILAGKGGAGKSTTALSCMRAGMQYISEDYCLLSDLPEIKAYSVYNSAKITDQTLTWFPELKIQITNPGRVQGEKAFFFHQIFQPHKIALSTPVKAIFALTVAKSRDSYFEPLDWKEATAALSISTMWQLTHSGPVVFQHLKRVTEALPCYKLHLGSDIEQAPRLIEKFL